MPFQRLWQALFILALMATVGGGAMIAPVIQIDTNLADISPSSQHSPNIKEAADALQNDIHKRIILLISGSHEDPIYDAEEALRDALQEIDNVSVLPSSDDVGEQVLAGLKPFRFSLLTENQSAKLTQASAEELAQQAQEKLYSLSGQERVYSFEDDPLGWHSETLIALLSNASSQDPTAPLTAISVGLSIEQNALHMTAQQTLSTQLDQVISGLEKSYDVTIDRSGIFFFASEAAKESKQDISLISTGSTIGVILLLLFVFRSVKALILPVMSITFGVGFAFVLTHLIYGNVHVLTIVFGASLIGIVVDYSLHYFYHGAQPDQTTHTNERQALFRALALSLMTSVIGYAALSFSSLQALQKVAMFSCCGLVVAWLSVICLGGLLARNSLKTEQVLVPKLVFTLSNALHKLPTFAWLAVAVMLLIGGTSVALIIKPYNDDPRVFFKPPVHLIESERRVAAVANDFEPGRYIVISGRTKQEIHQRHQALITKIAKSKQLSAAMFTSLLDSVPDVDKQKEYYLQQAKLYGPEGASKALYTALDNPLGNVAIQAQYNKAQHSLLSIDHLAALIGKNLPPLWFEQDDNLVSFVLIRKGVNPHELNLLLNGLSGVEYVDTLGRTKTALAQQRESASLLLFLAYLLVALLMIIRFRKISSIGLVMVPACASALLLITCVLAGFPLNLFHVMALFLVLGFGMDYAIFAHEMREHSSIALQAILISAVTSLLSFGLLSLSAIPVVASFGVTLLVGNLFNLLGAFVYARIQKSIKL